MKILKKQKIKINKKLTILIKNKKFYQKLRKIKINSYLPEISDLFD